MTIAHSAPGELDLPEDRRRIETILEDFLHDKSLQATAEGMPTVAASTLLDFVQAGGKRLRPMLCVLGWHAAGGAVPAPQAVLRVAAALEMFHVFCLIHDDVMDSSPTRRGRPTVHRALAHRYACGRSSQRAGQLGITAAILIGDLALCWSDELLHTADLTASQLARILPVVDRMRTEVMYGQYLDVTTTGAPSADLGKALTIIRYKTAKYTVERPLHLGAQLVGTDAYLLEALTSYAFPLGEAFQLRDDLLGVFGDPEATGKSRLDDLREGKHTVLLALALERADPSQREVLEALLGDPNLSEDDAGRIRDILTATGARTRVEYMITDRHTRALRALDCSSLSPTSVHALSDIAAQALTRIA